MSWNQPTFGEETWQQRYNYPDLGFSVAYQDLKNQVLGDVYSLYAHYNFYFLNRRLMLRIGQGLAYTSNPYDKETNFKNIAFGSSLMSSTYLMLNYKKEHIFDRFGIQPILEILAASSNEQYRDTRPSYANRVQYISELNVDNCGTIKSTGLYEKMVLQNLPK